MGLLASSPSLRWGCWRRRPACGGAAWRRCARAASRRSYAGPRPVAAAGRRSSRDRPCLRDSLPLHPFTTHATQEDLCPMHDGPCPRTASRRGVRTGHSLQERKQQRRPQGHRHSRQERQRGAQRPCHHRRARAALGRAAARSHQRPGQPIDPALVSQRKGRGGRVFDYLEGHAVIDQANRIFGYGGWGYELVGGAPRNAA